MSHGKSQHLFLPLPLSLTHSLPLTLQEKRIRAREEIYFYFYFYYYFFSCFFLTPPSHVSLFSFFFICAWLWYDIMMIEAVQYSIEKRSINRERERHMIFLRAYFGIKYS